MFSTAPAVPALQETPAQRAAFYTTKAHGFAQKAQAAHTDAYRADMEAQAAKYLRLASYAQSQAPATEAASVEPITEPAPIAQPEPVAPVEAAKQAPKPLTVRSERVQAQRAFYAACKAAGLDTRKADGMKVALCKYLSLRPGFSRADLSAGQWAEAIAGVEFGLLAW